MSYFIFFRKINDSGEHVTYICSKAFVKIKISIWAPIKFLYVYLENKELLISGVTCEKNCSIWGKFVFPNRQYHK